MKLQGKKYCDLCGDKLGIRGCYKLLDGNMCKTCARSISPFLTDYPNTYVADMQAHLDYRIGNSETLTNFHPTKVIGTHAILFIDKDAQTWCFCPTANYQKFQPDILQYSQIVDCSITIAEEKAEIFRTDAITVFEKYRPPRYRTLYTFVITVTVNCTWYPTISYTINKKEIDSTSSVSYEQTQQEAMELQRAILSMKGIAKRQRLQVDATSMPMICPNCHGEVFPNEYGCCPLCGSFI